MFPDSLGGDLPKTLLAQPESHVLPRIPLISQDLQHRRCPRAPESAASDRHPDNCLSSGVCRSPPSSPRNVSAQFGGKSYIIWFSRWCKRCRVRALECRQRDINWSLRQFAVGPQAICLASTPRSFRCLRGSRSFTCSLTPSHPQGTPE
jgi:hypothetical protein